jgi:hypothetical protein
MPLLLYPSSLALVAAVFSCYFWRNKQQQQHPPKYYQLWIMHLSVIQNDRCLLPNDGQFYKHTLSLASLAAVKLHA